MQQLRALRSSGAGALAARDGAVDARCRQGAGRRSRRSTPIPATTAPMAPPRRRGAAGTPHPAQRRRAGRSGPGRRLLLRRPAPGRYPRAAACEATQGAAHARLRAVRSAALLVPRGLLLLHRRPARLRLHGRVVQLLRRASHPRRLRRRLVLHDGRAHPLVAPWSPYFTVVGPWYYWNGPYDPFFWSYWPYYSFFYRSYYPSYYAGGRFYRGGGYRAAPPITRVPATGWRGSPPGGSAQARRAGAFAGRLPPAAPRDGGWRGAPVSGGAGDRSFRAPAAGSGWRAWRRSRSSAAVRRRLSGGLRGRRRRSGVAARPAWRTASRGASTASPLRAAADGRRLARLARCELSEEVPAPQALRADPSRSSAARRRRLSPGPLGRRMARLVAAAAGRGGRVAVAASAAAPRSGLPRAAAISARAWPPARLSCCRSGRTSRRTRTPCSDRR